MANPPLPIDTLWQRRIWSWVTIGLGIAGALLITLVGYAVYRTTGIVDSKKDADLVFIFSGLALVNSTLLRLLAMLVGAGVIFGGLAVSFFTHANENNISGEIHSESGSTKAMLASRSPGLIGVFVGGVIIVAALYARSTQTYTSPSHTSINLPPLVDQTAPATPKLPNIADLLKNAEPTPKSLPAGTTPHD